MIITIKATCGSKEATVDFEYDDADISFVIQEILVLLTRYGYRVEDVQNAVIDCAEEIADERMKQ